MIETHIKNMQMDMYLSFINDVRQLLVLLRDTVYKVIKATYFDIILSNDSMFWGICLVLWSMVIIIKYASMSYYGIIWCIRSGQKYHDYLEGQENITEKVIREANNYFNRKPIGAGPWIRSLFPCCGKIIFFIYRMPVIFIGTALLLGIFILMKQPKDKIIYLIALLLFGLFIQVALRFASRLYLGRYADIDESLSLKGNTDVIDDKLLKYLSFRRVIILYLIDILIFLFCFTFIHLGVNYYYCYNAYKGIESHNFWRQLIDFFYFTLITFTTTGFGDIVPNGDYILARGVTSIQILLGFLYVVGLILLLSLTTRAESFISSKKNDR